MMEPTDEGQPLIDTTSQHQEMNGINETNECTICRSALEPSQAVMDCRQCRQVFHYSCYHRHLQTSPRGGCPTCRYGAIPDRPLQSQNQNQNQNGVVGAAAPFMPMMPHAIADEQADRRVLQYGITKCLLFCYLFFIIPSIPIAVFVLWPYAIMVWLGALLPSTLLVYFLVPNHSIPAIKYTLYGSLAAGVFSAVFGTILSSSQAIGWISLYTLVCGVQEGLFVGGAIKLFLYGRYLRSQGLYV